MRRKIPVRLVLTLWGGYFAWLMYIVIAFVPMRKTYPYCFDGRWGAKEEIRKQLSRPFELHWMNHDLTAIRRSPDGMGAFVNIGGVASSDNRLKSARLHTAIVRRELPEQYRARFPEPSSRCDAVKWYAAKHMYDYGRGRRKFRQR